MSDTISKINTLLKLKNNYVTIGIQGEKGEQKKLVRTISAAVNLRDYKKKHKLFGKKVSREKIDPNLTVAQVAQWMEFGTRNIPARPFLRQTFYRGRARIISLAKKLIKNGDVNFYEKLGLYTVGLIQSAIRDREFQANSLQTIKRKGSSTPLVDTGQLRNSITYKVSSYD